MGRPWSGGPTSEGRVCGVGCLSPQAVSYGSLMSVGPQLAPSHFLGRGNQLLWRGREYRSSSPRGPFWRRQGSRRSSRPRQSGADGSGDARP